MMRELEVSAKVIEQFLQSK